MYTNRTLVKSKQVKLSLPPAKKSALEIIEWELSQHADHPMSQPAILMQMIEKPNDPLTLKLRKRYEALVAEIQRELDQRDNVA